MLSNWLFSIISISLERSESSKLYIRSCKIEFVSLISSYGVPKLSISPLFRHLIKRKIKINKKT